MTAALAIDVPTALRLAVALAEASHAGTEVDHNDVDVPSLAQAFVEAGEAAAATELLLSVLGADHPLDGGLQTRFFQLAAESNPLLAVKTYDAGTFSHYDAAAVDALISGVRPKVSELMRPPPGDVLLDIAARVLGVSRSGAHAAAAAAPSPVATLIDLGGGTGEAASSVAASNEAAASGSEAESVGDACSEALGRRLVAVDPCLAVLVCIEAGALFLVEPCLRAVTDPRAFVGLVAHAGEAHLEVDWVRLVEIVLRIHADPAKALAVQVLTEAHGAPVGDGTAARLVALFAANNIDMKFLALL